VYHHLGAFHVGSGLASVTRAAAQELQLLQLMHVAVLQVHLGTSRSVAASKQALLTCQLMIISSDAATGFVTW